MTLVLPGADAVDSTDSRQIGNPMARDLCHCAALELRLSSTSSAIAAGNSPGASDATWNPSRTLPRSTMSWSRTSRDFLARHFSTSCASFPSVRTSCRMAGEMSNYDSPPHRKRRVRPQPVPRKRCMVKMAQTRPAGKIVAASNGQMILKS